MAGYGDRSAVSLPRVSVVMATYQRRQLARRALESLFRQSAPPEAFEVVVVVDGSSDGTAENLRSLEAPFALRVVEQANRGQAAALNRGVEESRGPVCLFLDDDIEAGANVVERHIAAHDGPPVLAVGRLSTSTMPFAAPLARAMARALNDHYRRLQDRAATWADCYGSNTSMPRSAILDAGGFRENLARCFDTELAMRLSDTGLSVVYLDAARATQRFQKSGQAIVRDLTDEGSSDVEIWRRHPPVLARLKLGQRGDIPPRARAARVLLRPIVRSPRLLARVDAFLGRSPVARRWHHLVREACYWRGVRLVASHGEWASLSRTVPILLYHAVATPDEPASRYVIPASRLFRQMLLLRLLGRTPIALSDYVSRRVEGRPPPARSVVVTFDDGFADVVARGLPVLERMRVPATLFVVTGSIGRPADWVADGPLAERPLADESSLARWLERGMELGAHTRSHPRLPDLDLAGVERELAGSLVDLEQLLGCPTLLFAYPFGATDGNVRDAAMRAGFSSACGVRPGVNSAGTPLFELHRVEVDGRASLLRFGLALMGRDSLVRRVGGDT